MATVKPETFSFTTEKQENNEMKVFNKNACNSIFLKKKAVDRILAGVLALMFAGLALPARSATMCSGNSASVTLDLTTGTRRCAEIVNETICYSTEWVDGAASDATAVVTVNGETLNSATGSGVVTWTPSRNGTFILEHKVMSGGTQIGETLTMTFVVEGLKPNVPIISPASGTIFDAATLSVSISCSTTDAVIHYTTDGSEPTVDSPVYSRFKISGKTTVKAIAVLDGVVLSDVAVAEYARGKCGDVTIDAVDSFTGSKTKVVISCATEGATIRYTLNGAKPNSRSKKYTGPFNVTDGCTIKACASTDEFFDSDIATHQIVKIWNIGDTMGKPDHGFTTDGTGGAGWTRVTDATAPNGEAMKSGAITHGQSSVLSTKVMGPGALSFSWRTSCEQDDEYEWDHAELSVDGTVKLRLNGVTEWTAASVRIDGDGEHTVEWRYVKDDVEGAGEDAAWVAGYGWASDYTATQTTAVHVPYAWLMQLDPDIVDEFDAYEAAAKVIGANGYRLWESYMIGANPNDRNDVLRITAFSTKADGTLDIDSVMVSPSTSQWNAKDATLMLKGKATLDGGDGWQPVTEANKARYRFFKAEVVAP